MGVRIGGMKVDTGNQQSSGVGDEQGRCVFGGIGIGLQKTLQYFAGSIGGGRERLRILIVPRLGLLADFLVDFRRGNLLQIFILLRDPKHQRGMTGQVGDFMNFLLQQKVDFSGCFVGQSLEAGADHLGQRLFALQVGEDHGQNQGYGSDHDHDGNQFVF